MKKGIKIIFENPDFLVIDKPAGISVHGGPSVKEKTLVDFLLQKYPQIKNVGENPDRPGIVHRLDKDTSGLMVVARTPKIFMRLKSEFGNRKVSKKYFALCWGKFSRRSGCIKSYVGKSRSNPTRQSESDNPAKVKNPKEAITEYVVLCQREKIALVEAAPKTGRMHQIRIHLHRIGHSIVGDQKYQTKKLKQKNAIFKRHFLHSFFLAFNLNGGKYEFETEIPEEFKKIIDDLG